MPQKPIAPGDVLLEKYRVERVLGQGGMGFVVAVRHTELDELFAIKLMLPGTLESDDAERRFLREARSAVRLKGEHSVRVHDVGRTENGSLYMVMEHLEGDDLKAHLAQNGPLPVEEAVSHVLQACEGIGEAHDRGIIHRDIKPANLFLTMRRSGVPCIKILDFGISKQTSGQKSGDITKTGAMLGSPLYMSPEQMAHAHDVDARTDIWSLGVVLYELLTGKAPFEGETFTQVVHRVLNTEPKPLRDARPDAPQALEDVVMRCLAKEPEKRFESVDALAAALRPILGMPASTRSLPFADTMDEAALEIQPPRAVEASTGPSTTGMSTSRDNSSRKSLPARAGRGWFWLGISAALAIVVVALAVFLRNGATTTKNQGAAAMPLDDTPVSTGAARVEEPRPTSEPSVEPSSMQAEASPAPSGSEPAPMAQASTANKATKAAAVHSSKTPVEMVASTASAAPPVPPPGGSTSTKTRKHSMY